MPWIALGVFVVVVLIVLAAVVLMVNPAQAADARSPFDYNFLTYLWVLCLSAFGGIVNFSRKLRDARTTPFRLTEFVGEIATSSFAGLLTFWLCEDIGVDVVFIGSCTNSRIEDMRAAAAVAKGRKVASGITTYVVPGSHIVKAQAEAEGLDVIFKEAGFDWREPGCSMCLAMNPDKLEPGQRSASTSNRNFEGRQGRGGRTHLVSPAVATATAIAGHFASPDDLA